MKYVVGTVGGLIVVAGAFVGIMLLPTLVFPTLYRSMAGVVALYVVGTPLALVAGFLSFRATLRHYAKQNEHGHRPKGI